MILAIETTCDDTCAAVVDGDGEVRSSHPLVAGRPARPLRRRRARGRLATPPRPRGAGGRGGARGARASLDDIDARRGHPGPRADRRPARRPRCGQGARVLARPAARARRPPARPRRRARARDDPLEPPFAVPARLGRPHAAARRRRRRASSLRARRHARRRRGRGLRQGRPAARPGLPRRPGARAALAAQRRRRAPSRFRGRWRGGRATTSRSRGSRRRCYSACARRRSSPRGPRRSCRGLPGERSSSQLVERTLRGLDASGSHARSRSSAASPPTARCARPARGVRGARRGGCACAARPVRDNAAMIAAAALGAAARCGRPTTWRSTPTREARCGVRAGRRGGRVVYPHGS